MTMRPNPSSPAARAVLRERATRPPTAAGVALRPLGYLLTGLIWTALSLVVLALPAALPFGFISTGTGPLSDVVGRMDPLVGVLCVVFFGAFIGPLLGYVFLALPFACIPPAVLSFTYVVRSLRPDFRGERLSSTGWSREVIGPVTVLPTGISLLPLRMTRWTRFWTALYLLGWVPGRGLLVAAVPVGIGYLVTVLWTMWPVHSTLPIVVWSLVSAAFAVVTIVLVVRAARQRLR